MTNYNIIKPQSSQRLRKVRKGFMNTQNFAPFAVKNRIVNSVLIIWLEDGKWRLVHVGAGLALP